MNRGLPTDDRRRGVCGNPRLITAETLLLFFAAAGLHFSVFHHLESWPYVDGAFHYLVMEEIWRDGPWRRIDWLPYTVLGDAGPDHHWLFHLMFSPFAAIDDRLVGAHAANAVSFALIPASLNLALRMLGVRHAPVWVLIAMATTTQPFFRWSLLRANTLASAYLVLFMVALAKRHKPSLILVPFLFMQSYHGAAMLALPAVFMSAVGWWRTRVFDRSLLVLPAFGGLLALLISPWYPDNIDYFLFHVLDKVGNRLGLDIGLEWHPLPVTLLVQRTWPQLAVLSLLFIAAHRKLKFRFRDDTVLALATSGLMTIMTLKHSRFIEYLPQLFVFSAALLARDTGFPAASRKWRLAILFVCICAAWQTARTTMDVHLRKFASEYATRERFRTVGSFLVEHVAAGEVITNTEWGDFPMLVVNAPSLRFVAGLDPYYLAHGSPDKFLALSKLDGTLPIEPEEVIDVREIFRSEWVITRHQPTVDHLRSTGQASALFSDRWGVLIYLGRDPAIVDALNGLSAASAPARKR